jgi:hypothetical protein
MMFCDLCGTQRSKAYVEGLKVTNVATGNALRLVEGLLSRS